MRNTPLYYAAANGDEAFCQYLHRLGADVNARCENGNTPLHMAFRAANSHIIIQMLHAGGDLNLLNFEGHTPVAFGSPHILSELNMMHKIATVQTPHAPHLTDHNNNKHALPKRTRPEVP